MRRPQRPVDGDAVPVFIAQKDVAAMMLNITGDDFSLDFKIAFDSEIRPDGDRAAGMKIAPHVEQRSGVGGADADVAGAGNSNPLFITGSKDDPPRFVIPEMPIGAINQRNIEPVLVGLSRCAVGHFNTPVVHV